MNHLLSRRFEPHLEVVEELLIRTAIRVELPPSRHALAVDRYEAVRRQMEREGSPLKDRVRLFYPQGSMAIRATIRSRKRGDGYDIDIVAELILPPGMAPGVVLDLLYAAINGEKGSRYYGKVRRQSRCVTVEYEDGMHLDVIPRLSHIFHAKPEEPLHQHRRLVMNSFGFVEHVKERTPTSTSASAMPARSSATRTWRSTRPRPARWRCRRMPSRMAGSRSPSSPSS
jgi:hypothetical protein